jgi:protoheme IX farnesyltransferase
MSSHAYSITPYLAIGLQRMHAYLQLTKHKVVALMLLSAAVGMLLGYHAPFPWWQAFASLMGIGLLAAAGGATNQIIDMQRDQAMQRTQDRPLATGVLSIQEATLVTTILGISGTILLWQVSNPLATFLTLGAMIGYAVIYTMILKHITPQNIVIGGINGALPPLLGWVSLYGSISPQPLLLVLIIYTWTPPHFWALAIAKYTEYAATGTPMLPVTHGIPYTKSQIMLYTLHLSVITLLPIAIGMSGWLYGLGMLYLNARYIYLNLQLYREAAHRYAMPSFLFSIRYLLALFILVLVDHMLRGVY